MSDLSQPQAAAGIVEDLETARTRALVARLLRAVRHSFVTVHAQTATPVAAGEWCNTWERHIAATGLTAYEIRAGLSRLAQWPEREPFNLPTFVRLCRPDGDTDARRELDAARAAFARREFSGLDPATWQAAATLGFARVFNSDGVTDVGWRVALLEARRTPDPAILARQPADAAQLRIGESADTRAEARARNRAALDAAMGSLPDNLRPRRFSAPE